MLKIVNETTEELAYFVMREPSQIGGELGKGVLKTNSWVEVAVDGASQVMVGPQWSYHVPDGATITYSRTVK
jgi:hypothetical protein